MLRKTFLSAALMLPMLSPMLATTPVSAAVLAPWQTAAQQTQININTADAEQLAYALTGVGIKRAKDIIKLRDELGQFSDVNQLMQVKGIGPRMLELNKDRIVL
ncbi:ComEA family DNA-binding protein [Pseudidiomarina woesei]|uniref:Competence protein ComEA helix-hairpin-helix repeat region n=1 Tax=Pseudidiomarina woesei TaxID=1381080 RepID=A0A0K6GVL8_9GAMM|nr:helix-hairpin-helix domain-containing protein [Pseudidiomarina woesei]CUA82610.1 competence protein ComEA helix-hairpin-helix repeat region [Pseudidiomarina woesei]